MNDTAGPTKQSARNWVAVWLFAMCSLIAFMVIVGGATRLTDSGLSITEWRPVTGAVPPLTQDDWRQAFEKYRQIPEYELVNRGMSLEAFKQIYWWEWGHRFLGRVIGVAFLAPLLVFAVRRQIGRVLALKLFGVFLLGGLQGVLGWYMVKSGLSDRVDVSQYRLAAHLALAILLFALILWTALDQLRPRSGAPSKVAVFAFAIACAVYLQMILGAFVAGLRAGRTFNTWPTMDGKFFPDGYFEGVPDFSDLFETAAAAQFNHRIGAYVLTGAAFWFVYAAAKTPIERRARIALAAVLAQMTLGIATVVSGTPLALGLLHQAGALAVLSAAIYALHGCWTGKSSSNGLSSAA
jgi:cytochrome c oxidase assembly protein subunit 15